MTTSRTDGLELGLTDAEMLSAIESDDVDSWCSDWRNIADAATAKAAYAIAGWLDTPEARGALHTGSLLLTILQAAGIARPEKGE